MFAKATENQLAHIEQVMRHLDGLRECRYDNRRRACRVDVRTTMTAFLLLATNVDAAVTIFTRNLSASGIGFISRRLFSPGEWIALAFQFPNHPHKLVLTRIVFCRYLRAGWHSVGAEFMESVTDNHQPGRIPERWLRGGASRTLPNDRSE
jgi:hypothetical protein